MVYSRWAKSIAFIKGNKGTNSTFHRRQRIRPMNSLRHILGHTSDPQIIIHPRSNAVISDKGKWTQRDKLSKRQVQKIFEEGIHSWRRESGYYQQSRVENTFFRYKTTLGKKLRSRREDNRHVETVIGCDILNQFLELGRCKSEMVL